jgi:hypothetical protein
MPGYDMVSLEESNWMDGLIRMSRLAWELLRWGALASAPDGTGLSLDLEFC